MKEKIVEAFEPVEMPQDCEQRIRRAMAQSRRKRRPRPLGRAGVMAAVAALAITLSITPRARAAVEEAFRQYFFPEIGLTVLEKGNGNITHFDTESPAFARLREGRLYFTGNGENLDITDQITESEPFFYHYLDETGVEIMLVVGYSGSLENFGTYQFLRHPGKPWFTWVGRNNLNPETETRYPWVDIVWEKLDLPRDLLEG